MSPNKSLHRTAPAPRMVMALAVGIKALMYGKRLSAIMYLAGFSFASATPTLGSGAAGELQRSLPLVNKLMKACLPLLISFFLISWNISSREPEKKIEGNGYTVYVPENLVVTASDAGRSVTISATNRQSFANFEITSVELNHLPGYPESWTDLKGYFGFTKQTFSNELHGTILWACLDSTQIAPKGFVVHTSFLIHKGRFLQVMYSYRIGDSAVYGPLFAKILDRFELT